MAQLDFTSTTGFTNEQVTFTVASKNPNVKLNNIVIFIDSRSGRIPLPISTNGVMALPISPELMRENPNIVANQPKGSMTMVARIAVRGTLPDSVAENEDGLIRYSALFVAEKMKRQMAHDLTELKKEHDVEEGVGKADHRSSPLQRGCGILRGHNPRQGWRHASQTGCPGHFIIRFDPKLIEQIPRSHLVLIRK